MKKIFILDDEADFLISLKSWGVSKNYAIDTFENGDGFLESVLNIKPAVILIDINLRNEDGRLIAKKLKQTLPFAVQIVLISADPAALIAYQHFYADGMMNKPFSFAELDAKLQRHLNR